MAAIFAFIDKMNIKRMLYAAAAALMLPAGVLAQTGSTAYSFLELPTSAHAFALGSGVALVDDDVTLTDQNPALLGPEIDMQVALNYMHYMGSGNFAGVRFGTAAGERGAWAAGIRYLNYGTITQTDHTGVAGGTYKPQDIVFGATYAHDFTDYLRGGISLNGVYSNYEQYSAFALATDLGINYYNPDNDLSLSAVVKNLGGQLKRFDQSYDRLPIDVQLGYMQGLGTSPFSLAITAKHLTKWRMPYYTHKLEGDGLVEEKSGFMSNLFRHLVFGLQYSPSEKFYIALGYNYKTRTDMSAYHRSFLSGFSAGLGLKVKGFSFGVAYAQPHRSASSVMLNISTNLYELMHR